MDANALAAAWQNAEATGNYAGIADMLDGVSVSQLINDYGLSNRDIAYINNQTGANLALTPQEAQALLWDGLRSDPRASYSDIAAAAKNLGLDEAGLQSAYQAVGNQAFQNQFGRNAEGRELTDAAYYLSQQLGTLDQGLQALNNTKEGYNYDTQDIIAAYRQVLGRNPTQEEYVGAMATLGLNNFDRSALGTGRNTTANVAALESDPYAGRYAGYNPYDLPPDAVNVSTNTLGDKVQFTNPVTQKPMIASFENGNLVVRDGVDTMTGGEAAAAVGLAMATGGLTQQEYSAIQADLKAAKSMNDVYAAFSKPQAVAALDPVFGAQTGVGKTAEQAQANGAGMDALIAQLGLQTGGNMPSNKSIAQAATDAGVPYQFSPPLYDAIYGGQKPSTQPTTITKNTLPAAKAAIQKGVEQFATPSFTPEELNAPNELYGGWKDRRQTGASDGTLMGAGNANYNSSLIKSLRQNSMSPLSNNQGVMMVPNQSVDPITWTPPVTSGAAFSPQILNPRAASPQEVTDWNSYNNYRTNSLQAKTPYISFAEWLAGGKTGSKPTDPTNPAPNVPGPTTDSSSGGG